MKVKTFVCENTTIGRLLEQWLIENIDIEIKSLTQSQSTIEPYHRVMVTVIIFYV